MIISVIFRTFGPTTLQALGAVGFCSGVGIFTYGYRQHQVLIKVRALPDSKPANLNLESPGQPNARASGNPVLIRLSPELSLVKSADMTQQQKIAAALHRAGTSNTTAWSEIEPDDSGEAKPIAQIATAGHSSSTVAPPKPTIERTWASVFMIWAGPLLSLLSLYLILHTRGLF